VEYAYNNNGSVFSVAGTLSAHNYNVLGQWHQYKCGEMCMNKTALSATGIQVKKIKHYEKTSFNNTASVTAIAFAHPVKNLRQKKTSYAKKKWEISEEAQKAWMNMSLKIKK